MGIGKVYKRKLVEYFVTLIILLSGCESRNQEEIQTPMETEELNLIYTQTEERIVETEDKIEELVSKLQFSLKKISDEYELKLYDQSGNEVYSMMYPYPRKPYIKEVTENILEIGVSTGTPALNVFYFDKVSGKTSIGYMNPIYVDGKYIAYMDQDKLIFADIFKEDIYLEIRKEFSPAITPVTNIKMLDSETILVQYYTGENFIEVQEEISIKELIANKTIISYP